MPRQLPNRTLNGKNVVCFGTCLHKCHGLCYFPTPDATVIPPPPPPPRNRPLPHQSAHLPGKTVLLMTVLITTFVITVIFIFCTLSKMLRQYYYSRRRTRPVLFSPRVDFSGDDEAPPLDPPVWYIRTVGLQQSVIDSIAVFKYNRDEKLVDASECSVCLAEFQHDENLRLLPKCTHAFHVTCIDTWLRLHKNCPLCRAPVISNTAAAQLLAAEMVPGESGRSEDAPVEENRAFPVSDQAGEDGTGEIAGAGDLSENLPAAEDKQPMRRSVSLNSVSAAAIYQTMTNVEIREEESSSSSSNKNSNSRIVPKRGSVNQSVVKSASFRRSMEKIRHCRTRSLVLPL